MELQVRVDTPPDRAGLKVMMVIVVRVQVSHLGSQYINVDTIWQD
jgi:hypothetical protein